MRNPKSFNKPSEILSSYIEKELLVPDEYHQTGVKQLSTDEKEILFLLWEGLKSMADDHQVQIVYRGERNSNLRKKLFDSQEDYTFGRMLVRQFYFGEKAKYYFKQTKNTLGKNNYLKYINDISPETFEFIFEKFNLIVNSFIDNLTPKISGVINKFNSQDDHRVFVSTFQNIANLPYFLEQIKQIVDPQEKERVRDYYLYLLHTFGQSGIGDMSFFVSTSTSSATAMYFAKNRQINRKKSVVFIYMIPKPFDKYGISSFIARQFHERYKHTGLPLYNQTFYPKQEEISIKGALFPHYIMGLHDVENDRLILNPYIFRQSNLSLRYVPISGLHIDQTNFDDLIKDTGHTGYVLRQWSGQYSDNFHR